MDEVLLNLNEKPHGHFYINEDNVLIAEMQIDIVENDLTVYHTEVAPGHEGRGLAKKLLLAMVDYARKNYLMVVALCPYVIAQFKRNPGEYVDVWKNKV